MLRKQRPKSEREGAMHCLRPRKKRALPTKKVLCNGCPHSRSEAQQAEDTEKTTAHQGSSRKGQGRERGRTSQRVFLERHGCLHRCLQHKMTARRKTHISNTACHGEH